jgi:hypothetical protein
VLVWEGGLEVFVVVGVVPSTMVRPGIYEWTGEGAALRGSAVVEAVSS